MTVVEENVDDRTLRRPPDSFSTPQVCRLTGASYRQVDYWCRTDVLRPSVRDPRGSGSQRRYSRDDVQAAALLMALNRLGMAIGSRPVKAALRAFREADPEARRGAWLVLDSADRAHVVGRDSVLDVLAAEPQRVLVLVLDGLIPPDL